MITHIPEGLTKPSQVPGTGNQSICQVVYTFQFFSLHTFLRLSRV